MASREYHRKYNKNRYRKLRKEIIEYLGGKCVRCGSTENLEIDHKNPEEKSFNISDMITYPKEILLPELNKCQILCNECHKGKTLEDFGMVSAKITHGTLSSYRYCHCKLCKDAKAAWTREYRKTYLRNKQSPVV